ncbi:MAG: hypothetical protein AAGC55_26615 [Myxococcota bacterium]
MRLTICLTVITLAAACAGDRAAARPTTAQHDLATDERCRLVSAPVLVRQQDAAVLQYWEFPLTDSLLEPVLPSDPGLRAYRAAVATAGAAAMKPDLYIPQDIDDNQRSVWERERENVAMAYRGQGGVIRPIHCLESLFFAEQHARYSQLNRGTEFIVSVLRKTIDGQTVIKAYFTAGAAMFPPKQLYSFDEAAADVANGWEFWFVLHNHTFQEFAPSMTLGVPVPSTSDIELSRALVASADLRSIRVTNGFYTIDVPRDVFHKYLVR